MKNTQRVINYSNKTADQIRKGYMSLRARYKKSVSICTQTNKGGLVSGWYEISM